MKNFPIKLFGAAAIMISLNSYKIAHAETYPDKIIACGWGYVDIIDISTGKPKKVWSFHTHNSKGYTNCLAYNHNKQILAASVWTGIDIIDTASKTITAHWDLPCAHDAVWLPHHVILAVRSTCTVNNQPYEGGLYLYDGKHNGSAPISKLTWNGAHFAIPNNDKENTFWVTNYPHLSLGAVLDENTNTPSIKIEKEYTPEIRGTGHAAAKSIDGKTIAFSNTKNIFALDLSTQTIRPFFANPIESVKSLDYDKNTGLLMWMATEPPATAKKQTTVHFEDGSSVALDNPHYYRAFWYYGDIPGSKEKHHSEE